MAAADRLSDLAGRRAVVTGATNGIGLATARALAGAGLSVVLAVRNAELGERRVREFGGDVTVREVDLADLTSVRNFAAGLDGEIDYLINNAGMASASRASAVRAVAHRLRLRTRRSPLAARRAAHPHSVRTGCRAAEPELGAEVRVRCVPLCGGQTELLQ